ncbi:hypothetical protein BST66_27885 [Bradyrhizobium canariense]|nr:hypothetical protein BST66_27885 [Bradyrhizobium canariense]OSI50379.1 hypothetical protein BSZ15_32690 [Bradyrhizobium canariense]
MAERVCKARDACPADARAQLHQIDHDHGRDVAVAVVQICKIIVQRRREEAMAVFEGLPPDITFEAALAIKRERRDPSAEGWMKLSDGSFAKKVRAKSVEQKNSADRVC